jgi:hypothetical protein
MQLEPISQGSRLSLGVQQDQKAEGSFELFSYRSVVPLRTSEGNAADAIAALQMISMSVSVRIPFPAKARSGVPICMCMNRNG